MGNDKVLYYRNTVDVVLYKPIEGQAELLRKCLDSRIWLVFYSVSCVWESWQRRRVQFHTMSHAVSHFYLTKSLLKRPWNFSHFHENCEH